jgi:hypothetical protein
LLAFSKQVSGSAFNDSSHYFSVPENPFFTAISYADLPA